MGIRIAIEIGLTRPKHLSHLTCVCVLVCVWASRANPLARATPPTRSRQSRSSFEYAARNDFVLVEIAALITQQQRQCDRLQRACWCTCSKRRLRNFTFTASNRSQHVASEHARSRVSDACCHNVTAEQLVGEMLLQIQLRFSLLSKRFRRSR